MSVAEAFIADTVSLDEGLRDQHILKAIFVLGAGGSGKSSVADAMFAGFGLKTINQDRHLERFLKDARIPLDQAGSDYGIFKKAQKLRGKELRHYAMRRLGLLIDMTGWDYGRVAKPAAKLRELGYDIYMIFVTTSLATALRRNKARGEQGKRKVPSSFVSTAHRGAHKNLAKYRTLFGKKNLFVVSNDKDLPEKTWKSMVAPALRKIGNDISRRPLKNPVGKKWIKQQETNPNLDDPDRVKEWPEPPKPEPTLFHHASRKSKKGKGLGKKKGDSASTGFPKGAKLKGGRGTKLPKLATGKAVSTREQGAGPSQPPTPKLPTQAGSRLKKFGKFTVDIGKKAMAKFRGKMEDSTTADIVSAFVDEGSDPVTALANKIRGTKDYALGIGRATALYKARGDYDGSVAHKMALHLVSQMAKKFYGPKYYEVYTPEVRLRVQKKLAAFARDDAGKHNSLLPKKYQKGFKGYDETLQGIQDFVAKFRKAE